MKVGLFIHETNFVVIFSGGFHLVRIICKSQNVKICWFFIPTCIGWCSLVTIPNLSLSGRELFSCLVRRVLITNLVPPILNPNLVPLVLKPSSVPLIPIPNLVISVSTTSPVASSVSWVPIYFLVRLPTHCLFLVATLVQLMFWVICHWGIPLSFYQIPQWCWSYIDHWNCIPKSNFDGVLPSSPLSPLWLWFPGLRK